MRKISLFVLILLLVMLVSGCGGSGKNVTEADETSDEIVEEVPGKDTNLALYPGSVRVYFEESESTFLIEYWVPAPLEDVINFYKEEYPDEYQFEGAYADGEYTLHHDEYTDSGEIETFVIEIGNYYKNQETESKVNIQGTIDFLSK
jgi:ABC-type glycerol-3-phosphate transport system substrate-binding protein